MSTEGKIPAYFSHSYRAEDREVNQFFWKLFWQSDFSFTVDPESETISFPHLELMMRYSACFVAIATHRPQQPFYRSSPFIAYEYGLSVRAQKPRLMFIETGVPSQYFPETSVTFAFDRRRLEDRREDFLRQIEQLALQSRAYSSIGDRPRGPAGLILPPTPAYRETRGYSMVRGISDVPRTRRSKVAPAARGSASPQTQERDQWKKYASEAAAVLTVQIIQEAWRQPPRGE